MPPPLAAMLPLKVERLMLVMKDATEIAPPRLPTALLPENVLAVTFRTPPLALPSMAPPGPEVVELLVKVLDVIVIVPPAGAVIAPPFPDEALLLSKTQLVMFNVSPVASKIAPPPPVPDLPEASRMLLRLNVATCVASV